MKLSKNSRKKPNLEKDLSVRTSPKNYTARSKIEYTLKVKMEIERLKQKEKEDYEPSIIKLCNNKNKDDLKKLTKVLNELGDLTQEMGKLSKKLKYYTDAVTFYQYAINITKDKIKLKNNNDIDELYEKLYQVKQSMVPHNNISNTVRERSEENKKILTDLRLKANNQIKEIEKKKDLSGAKKLFEDMASGMNGLLAKLYKEAEKELGDAPCKYAVMGCGSLALQHITPYSDFEFAILTEDVDHDSKPEIRKYFKHLTSLVHFEVINLGETLGKYGWYLGDLVRKGISFDLGGKTPLGRIDKDKPYELIQTVDGMLWYVRNEGNKASHIDKNFPTVLEKAVHVYGDENLILDYQTKVSEFFHTDEHCQTRAIEVLKEGMVEHNYLKISSAKPVKEIKGDIQRHKPKFDIETEGKSFEVKQEIYRLPDRLLYDLGLYYGLQGSAWDIVDGLYKEKVIGEEAAKNLKYAVSFATMLRLKTYLHNKEQREDMSIFARDEEEAKIFHLPKEDLEEQGSLFKYFYIAIELHRNLEKFCDTSNRKDFFKHCNFYQDDNETKGNIYSRLLRYDKAIECHKKSLDIRQKIHGEEHFYTAQSYNNLALVYRITGNYKDAIECHKKSLYIRQKIHGEEHSYTAQSYNNLGVAYYGKGNKNYDEAVKNYEKCLKIRKKIYKEQPHSDIIESLNNLGLIYNMKGEYDKSMKYYVQCSNMCEAVYKNHSNEHYADILNNLGDVYCNQGNYKDAIECHKKSLDIREKIYEKKPHRDIAQSYNNIGSIYFKYKNYDKATEYFKIALDIGEEFYGRKPHFDVAGYLNNLGIIYRIIKNYDEALKQYEKSLQIYKKIHNDNSHEYYAICLNNIGSVYLAKEDYNNAMKYYTKGLRMKQEIYKKHPSIAISLNNIGEVYQKLNIQSMYVEYVKQAYAMSKNCLGIRHPQTIELFEYISKYDKEFTGNNESRLFIVKRGIYNDDVFKIIKKLQKSVFNKVQIKATNGTWDTEMISYLEGNNLKRELGQKLSTVQNLELTKLLCFEAINIGIMLQHESKRNFKCAKEFAKANPDLVKLAAKGHPEYFVDGSILKACKEQIEDDNLIQELLGCRSTASNNTVTNPSMCIAHEQSEDITNNQSNDYILNQNILQKKIDSNNEYKTIYNIGGGDCAIYAIRDTVKTINHPNAGHDINTIRQDVCKVTEKFMQLANEEDRTLQEKISLYKNIFGNFNKIYYFPHLFALQDALTLLLLYFFPSANFVKQIVAVVFVIVVHYIFS